LVVFWSISAFVASHADVAFDRFFV